MSGFEIDLRARLLAFTPQITIERVDGGVWNPAELEKKIAAIPGVVASAPFVTSQVMAVSSTESGAPGLVSGGILRGVEPHDNAVLKELKDTLEVGTLDDLADDASGDDRRQGRQAGGSAARRDPRQVAGASSWGQVRATR